MNALRLTEGVELKRFSQRTGLALAALEDGLQQARQRGLLSDDPARLAASAQGQLFLNDVLQIFLTAEQ
jgi:oxygen-independent coproporphyrinogen-3 oxidase